MSAAAATTTATTAITFIEICNKLALYKSEKQSSKMYKNQTSKLIRLPR